jgi:purine-binding chemotaxis protein CheW
MKATANWHLLCRVRAGLCALPLECVLETMRPLPVEPVAGTPAFVRGLSIIRGMPVPVVDAGALLGATDFAAPERFVTVRSGDRQVALAVDEVLGTHALSRAALADLPPLVREMSADLVSALGTLDAALLLVLRAAHFVPKDVWQTLAVGESTA